jgi:hypothetical protein
LRARVQIAYKFRTNIFAARHKFEEQYKIFDNLINVINYCNIIIINAYYDVVINAWNNYISKGPARNMTKNVTVSGAAIAFCLNRRQQNVLTNVTFSPSHRQTGTPTINIQSTLHTAPICVKMFHCSVIW